MNVYQSYILKEKNINIRIKFNNKIIIDVLDLNLNSYIKIKKNQAINDYIHV
jgi:hypothetical protein